MKNGTDALVFPLAFRNIKKSVSDYVIYFVTLIVGVCLFYIFQAMLDQRILEEILRMDFEKVELLQGLFLISTVLVTLTLAFLVFYASRFFMRRRHKELALYMLLGMKKTTIAGVLITENLIVGGFSLVLGILSGIVLSQGVSVAVIRMFGADMSGYGFSISGKAILQTILCFVIIYGVVVIGNLIVVARARLITLMREKKPAQKPRLRNPIVCAILLIVACFLLKDTYWRAIYQQESFLTTYDYVMGFGKGIVATYIIFWSLSGLLFVVKMRKRFFFRKIRPFTTKELSGHVNLHTFAMGSICLLIFLGICIFSVCLSINRSVNHNAERLTPVDVNFVSWVSEGEDIDTLLNDIRKKGLDKTTLQEGLAVTLYNIYWDESMETSEGDGFLGTQRFMCVSEYNKVAKLYGLEQISLQEDEYATVASYPAAVRGYNNSMKRGDIRYLGGRQFHPVRETCYYGYIQMAAENNELGFSVLPDSVMGTDGCIEPEICYYLANYRSNEAGRKFEEMYQDVEDGIIHCDEFLIVTRNLVKQQGVSFAGMIAFVGIYLGIICILASVALLSLKELTQAMENREKYQILQGLGVEQKMVHRSLLIQSLVFFLLPLILAMVHSGVGIYVSMHIMEDYGFSGMLPGITLSAIVILFVYFLYFILTYRCSCKMIDEK